MGWRQGQGRSPRGPSMSPACFYQRSRLAVPASPAVGTQGALGGCASMSKGRGGRGVFSEGICGPSLSWRQWAGTGALQRRRAGGGAGSLQSAPSLNRAGGLPCPDLPKAPQACGPPRDQRPIRQLLPSPRPDGRLGTKSRFCQAQASGRHRSASPQRPASLSWTSE